MTKQGFIKELSDASIQSLSFNRPNYMHVSPYQGAENSVKSNENHERMYRYGFFTWKERR